MDIAASGISHLSLSNDSSALQETEFGPLENATHQKDLDHLERTAAVAARNQVPLEILGEVFISMVKETREQSVLVSVNRVSRAWRAAALLVPQLWSSVRFAATSPHLSAEVMKAWLSRAGGYPRTMHVTLLICESCSRTPDPIDGSSPALPCPFRVNSTMADILHTGPSLHTLNILFANPQCLINLNEAMGHSPPNCPWNALNALVIERSPVGRGEAWGTLNPSLDSLPPSLRALQVSLASIHDRKYDPAAARPLNIQRDSLRFLTSLSLTAAYLGGHIFATLQHCEQLEALSLDFEDVNFHPSYVDAHASLVSRMTEEGLLLPCLQTLRLHHISVHTLVDFNFLRMPRLRHASICLGWTAEIPADGLYIFEPLHVRALARLLRGDSHTPSTLTHLELSGTEMSHEGSMFKILHGLDGLVAFHLHHAYFRPDSFSELLKSPRRWLPALRELKLTDLYWTMDNLVAMDRVAALRQVAQERGIELERVVQPREYWVDLL